MTACSLLRLLEILIAKETSYRVTGLHLSTSEFILCELNVLKGFYVKAL